MNRLHVIFVVLLVTPSLSGCLGPEDNRIQIEEPTPFDFASPTQVQLTIILMVHVMLPKSMKLMEPQFFMETIFQFLAKVHTIVLA